MESCVKLVLFFCSFFLLVVSPVDGSTEKQRCTFQFWNDASVDVKCEGREEVDKTYERRTLAPIEVISGLWLFGDPFRDGRRSFIVVEDSDIELHDIHFTDNLVPEGLEIVSPISIVNSTVLIRNCTFSSGSFPLAGGVYMSLSSVSVWDCSFFGTTSARQRSQAGAIRLTNNSSLNVERSNFLKVTSDVSAIYSDLQSNITISNSVFKVIKGKDASAIAVKGGHVHLYNSDFTSCKSTSGNGALSMLDGQELLIESCKFKLNHGKHGAAVYFYAPSPDIDMSSHGQRPRIEIRQSAFESNVAATTGGGLYINGADLIMTGSSIAANQAAGYGAGLLIINADQVTIASSTVEHQWFKQAYQWWERQSGAGIYAQEIGRFLLLKSQIVGNHARYSGGGARFSNVQRLEIHDSVIADNRAEDQAGISAESVKRLKMVNVTVETNHAESVVGGMNVVENSYLTLQKTRFIGNTAQLAQGALSILASKSIRIVDSQFEQNRADAQFAAGLYIYAALNVSIERSIFHRNTAGEEGAGVHARSVDLVSIKDSIFTENSAHSGGACFVKVSDEVRIISSSFRSNEASVEAGGSVLLDNVDRVSVHDSNFSRNRAKFGGGAIAGLYIIRFSSTLTQFLNNNSTRASGGGVNLREVDYVVLKGCTLSENGASMDGGAVSLDGVYNQIDIGKTQFTSNEATGRMESSGGGALSVGIFSKMKIKHSVFRDNRARFNGGALNLPTTPRELSRTLDMASNTFSANSALEGSGGAIYFEKSPRLSVDDCHFADNSASSKGGAILIDTGRRVSILKSRFERNKLIAEVVKSKSFSDSGEAEALGPAPIYNILSTPFGGSDGQIRNREKDGGAIALVRIRKVILTDTVLTANSAPGSGAGAYIQDAKRVVAHQNKFINNVASTSGGGLFGEHIRAVALGSSSFNENRVSREEPTDKYNGIFEEDGGALVLNCSRNIHLKRVDFTDNSATHSGGAASFKGVANVTVKECNFRSNSGFRGGAVHIRKSQQGVIDACVFSGNVGLGDNHHKPNALVSQSISVSDADHGGHGGAIVFEHSSDFNLTSPQFQSNWADGYGGAMFCNGSERLALMDGSFLDNQAFIGGGAIFLEGSNMSLNVNHFAQNQARDGGVLSIKQSFLSGQGLQTVQNLAENHGGLVYCQEPSNVTIRLSKFVDDGSRQGTAFMAGCSCHLFVVASKIVCSNADVSGCGSVASAEDCNGNVVLETANVIHFFKLWSLLALIIPAILVLPFVVVVVHGCARLSITVVNKAGWRKNASKVQDPDHDRFLDDTSEHSLDISIDNSISFVDSPFQNQPEATNEMDQMDTPRSFHLSEPLLEDDDHVSEIEKFIEEKPPALPTLSSKPSSAFIGPPFMHPAIDPYYSIPDVENPSPRSRPNRITDHAALDQHDFRAEYEEMQDMRSSLFEFRSSLDWQE